MCPFHLHCPETAAWETRSIALLQEKFGVPVGRYLFLEHYCDDLACDCRRVCIIVVRVEEGDETSDPLVHLSYGWESTEFYRKWSSESDPAYIQELASVTLNPLYEYCDFAHGLRELFEWVVEQDPKYRLRLAQHYVELRTAVRRAKPGGRSSFFKTVRPGGRRRSRLK